MACAKREKTGSCSHHQCEFAAFTYHGYECVEVVDNYCEAGKGCWPVCPYSWKVDDEETDKKANEAYDKAFPEDIVELSPAEHDAWPKIK